MFRHLPKYLIAFCCISLSAAIGGAGAQTQGFSLTSQDMKDGGILPMNHVYNSNTCTGDNISPHLAWSEPPAGTKSLALTLFDPDARGGAGFMHWIVYNIPSNTRELLKGAGTLEGAMLPKGSKQSPTGFGKPGYNGACPPVGSGQHRYIFTIYALDVEQLDAPEDVSVDVISASINAHVIAKASLVNLYGRP